MKILKIPFRKSAFILTGLLLLAANAGVVIAQNVVATHGMVASAQPLASQAGVEILRKGGNAVDAAVATAFALGVVEPNASGIGGGGFMLIRMAVDDGVVNIDFRECAPAAADSALYYRYPGIFDSLTSRGALSIGVPGTVAGLCLALEKYGTMTLSQVLAPAIAYASHGFEVSENFAGMIFQNYDLLLRYPATGKIYLVDDLPLSAGSQITNPDLIHTYQVLALNGQEAFYRGEMATAIAEGVRQQGGILTTRDLQNYHVLKRSPVKGTYHGYRIFSAAPPTGGGTHLIELLNILENFDLVGQGHNSADYIHTLSEAMKIVFADKERNMADPAFYRVPVQQLTSKEYAVRRLTCIDPEHASFNYQSPEMVVRESGNTTHLSVVDKQGNMVALTQSINNWFGSGITVPGTGILLNNHLADFKAVPGQPNSIEPGKRPVSSIAPTLIIKDGKGFLSVGTPGGTRIISALAQIIINLVDFGMNIDEAIEAPRIHAEGQDLHLEGRIPETVREDLQKKGHHIKIHKDFDNYFGGAQGILIKTAEGKLTGGADSRRDGAVSGY
jgi:gamma-glutamyltranspeptidase/glutathione hydrolase